MVLDSGPDIVSFVVDGKFDDGGEYRQFGWGRFDPNLRDINGEPTVRAASPVLSCRVYNRALMTSEVISNFRAGF